MVPNPGPRRKPPDTEKQRDQNPGPGFSGPGDRHHAQVRGLPGQTSRVAGTFPGGLLRRHPAGTNAFSILATASRSQVGRALASLGHDDGTDASTHDTIEGTNAP